jgi:uncharacterized surface protein with fasciclin (FAS1) repeats
MLAPALGLAIGLAGCSGAGDGGNGAVASGNAGAAAPAAPNASPSDAKLAGLITADPQLERLNRIVDNAGMAQVLNGVGPYTLFAPTNAAFDALGQERADALAGEAMRPQAAALLRAHMVPGMLTRRDLMAAIDGANGQPVRMKTMAGNMLSFAREGEAIVVTSDDGARARVTGSEGLGANGAVQPVDGVLRRAQGAQ